MSENKSTVSIAPWLGVENVQKAITFYKEAFSVSEQYSLRGDDGTPVIAQLSFGGSDFWIQEDSALHPESGKSFRIIITIPDPDPVFEQALAAGAIEIVPISEAHGWRIGRLEDPFGYHWEIGRQL
ncbi:VOC family protein [Fictibacillus fluitans]|uniref:VOC family protein n=1 Tax=Fictibacillus fluitans TaxID=3058422 RepID=A0ABT8HVW3_9BACL|nr:VOC family protein [Fictibacillus sp. NE201]MDN4524920.1 VOC family protein [Fictibacillus sp. NE201]